VVDEYEMELWCNDTDSAKHKFLFSRLDSCSVLGVFRWWLAALGGWLATLFRHDCLRQ
jgi:hypothetical protein